VLLKYPACPFAPVPPTALVLVSARLEIFTVGSFVPLT
jgi:hypothetical protein